jgi:hypothetical protein
MEVKTEEDIDGGGHAHEIREEEGKEDISGQPGSQGEAAEKLFHQAGKLT